MEKVSNGKTPTAQGSTGTETLEKPQVVATATEFEINVANLKLDADVSSNDSNELNGSYEVVGVETPVAGNNESAPLPALFGSYSDAEMKALFPQMRESDLQEVVIGPDNRVRINPTTTFPWRAICSLKITARNGQRFIGTGWLIAPRTVITAGHCVYMHNAGGWASSIEVIPALNDASRPYGSASSSHLRSTTSWVNSRDRNFDYACIILPANARLGDTTGYFGFAVRNDSFLMNAALNLSGYPGDKANGNQQWFMAQRPSSVNSKVITYQIDTFGGQSGAPVWVLENGNRYGVGIHTNGANSGNSATRIDQSVYNNLLAWKNMGL